MAMTEEDARRLAEAFAELTAVTNRLTAEERAAAEKAQAVRNSFTSAVDKTADVFTTFGKEAYKGTSAAKSSAASMEKLGEAAQEASILLALLIPGGPIIKAALVGVGMLANKLSKLAAEIGNQTAVIYDAYRDMAKMGATGSRGMQEVFDGLQKVGLGTQQFGAYLKLMNENAAVLATFGGTVRKGGEIFENTMDGLSNSQREQLEYMGLNREAQAEAGMAYLKQQRLLTQGTKDQMNTSSAAVMRYIDETDTLTRITGLNRKEQEKMVDAALRNEAFYSTIQEIREKHGPEAERRVLEAQAMAAKAGPATQKMFEAALSGFIGSSNEAQQAFMSSGGKMFELTDALRNGQIKTTRDTALAVNDVFKATGETAKQFRGQAQMMNYAKGGLGNYYEAINAQQLSLDDLTKAYDQSIIDKSKQDADTKKMAKAENDQRRAELAAQAALQLGMGTFIDKTAIASENLRILAEAALDTARALKKGEKAPGVPTTGPVTITQEAAKNRETSEARVIELQKQREQLEKEKGRADEETKKARIAEHMARRQAEIDRAAEETARRKAAREGHIGIGAPKPPTAPATTAPKPPAAPATTAPATTAPATPAVTTAPAAPATTAPATTAPATTAPATTTPAAPAAPAPASPAAPAAPAATKPATAPQSSIGAGLPGYGEPGAMAADQLAKIRQLIGVVESFGGNYNAVVGEGNKNFGLTEMTLAEIDQFQRNRLKEGKGTPVGKYQMHINTLAPTAQKIGISSNQKFDEETQDKLANFLIRTRGGYDQYSMNPTPEGKERLLSQLSMIWAGLPAGPDNMSYYKGTGNNKAHIPWTEALAKFADGGMVSSPTIAQIGEAGPEAVIPLKNGKVPVTMPKSFMEGMSKYNFLMEQFKGSFEAKNISPDSAQSMEDIKSRAVASAGADAGAMLTAFKQMSDDLRAQGEANRSLFESMLRAQTTSNDIQNKMLSYAQN